MVHIMYSSIIRSTHVEIFEVVTDSNINNNMERGSKED